MGPLQSLRPLSDVTPSRTDNKESILNASLGFVVEHGWSHTALARGATAVGLPAVAHGMFTRGGIELLEHFEQQCNERLVGFLQSETEQEEPSVMHPPPLHTRHMYLPFHRVRGSRMIKAAVERRLRMIIPYINRWPEVSS